MFHILQTVNLLRFDATHSRHTVSCGLLLVVFGSFLVFQLRATDMCLLYGYLKQYELITMELDFNLLIKVLAKTDCTACNCV